MSAPARPATRAAGATQFSPLGLRLPRKTKTDGGLARYRAALEELAGALRDARRLAEVMGFDVGQLLGEWPDLDGPPLTDLPTRSDVLAALRRIDQARSRLEREWHRLSGDEREALPSPDALADEG